MNNIVRRLCSGPTYLEPHSYCPKCFYLFSGQWLLFTKIFSFNKKNSSLCKMTFQMPITFRAKMLLWWNLAQYANLRFTFEAVKRLSLHYKGFPEVSRHNDNNGRMIGTKGSLTFSAVWHSLICIVRYSYKDCGHLHSRSVIPYDGDDMMSTAHSGLLWEHWRITSHSTC